jgi:hypothetical protein
VNKRETRNHFHAFKDSQSHDIDNINQRMPRAAVNARALGTKRGGCSCTRMILGPSTPL